MIAVPSSVLSSISRNFGHEVGGVLHLSNAGKTASCIAMVMMYLGSLLARGYLKAFLHTRYVSGLLLTLMGVSVMASVSVFTVAANSWIRALSASVGDGGYVVAYFLIWLLVLAAIGGEIGTAIVHRIADTLNVAMEADEAQRMHSASGMMRKDQPGRHGSLDVTRRRGAS